MEAAEEERAALAHELLAAARQRRDALVSSLVALCGEDAPSGDGPALRRSEAQLRNWLHELGADVTRHDGPAGAQLEGCLDE